MPKATGLTPEQRKALIADQIDPEDEPRDIAPTPAPPSYATEPVVEPVAAPSAAPPDMAALVQMLAAALQQSGANTAQAIKDGLADATTMARTPIPEGTDATNPRKSVYAHPLGDSAHPRTVLRAPMFLGVYDEDGKVIPAFEYIEGTTTERERVGLNRLTSGSYRVERNDGVEGLVRVQEKLDDLGAPIRVTVAVPFTWLQQEAFQQMPSLVRMLDQMLAAEAVAA